jgi:UDP-N-acetylglucosamine/UDP-N-acetylgalactosamine diphosphorylase
MEGPVRQFVHDSGQGHLFQWWDELIEAHREALLNQIRDLDFAMIEKAISTFHNGSSQIDFTNLKPAESVQLEGELLQEAKRLGEQAIKERKVCALTLAGGQGTRLGYELPKGVHPIGPVSRKSLFAWFADKIKFFTNRIGTPGSIPWLLMTSHFTDSEIQSFFQHNDFFGLGKENVHFLMQGLLPAVDFQGKLMMDAKHHICENPDGHGGLIRALRKSNLLETMARQGVQYIFIHNVDNCLVKVCDLAFIGNHIASGADFSCKSLAKRSPDETLGTIVDDRGKIRIIEYSDTPQEVACLRDERGQLVYRTGSINIYVIGVDFMQRLCNHSNPLPLHFTSKTIPALDSAGILKTPQKPNGYKLETKLFDILQYTDKAVVVGANRSEEFSPLKHRSGEESYEAVIQDLQALFLSWLEDSGVPINAAEFDKIELSPEFAPDRDSFRERVAAIGKTALSEWIERQIQSNRQIIL